MHPLLSRMPVLMEGAFQGAQAGTPPPAQVFFGTTFASATPDTVAGGNLVSVGFTLRRSGDLSQVVTVFVRVAGVPPAPLVPADVQGGLSDLQHQFGPGISAVSLQVTFVPQDLAADHFGEVSLHTPVGASIAGGVFDFRLVSNHQVVAGELPVPLRTVAVANRQQLLAAIAGGSVLGALQPGDHVCLADGPYGAGVAIPATVAGTPTDPVAFRAGVPGALDVVESILGATFSGDVTAAGASVVLRGLAVAGGGQIALAGAGGRASRCTVDTPDATKDGYLCTAAAPVVDYCEVAGCANVGIMLLTGACAGGHLHHNSVHDGVSGGRPNSKCGIMVGSTSADSAVSMGVLVELNRIWAVGSSEALEIKSSDNVVRYNTVIGDTSTGAITVRHGMRNRILANWSKDSAIALGDKSSVAVKNHTEGGLNASALVIKAGDCYGDQFRAGGGSYPAAEDALVVLHDGDVVVGWHNPVVGAPWPKAPLRTILEATVGAISAGAGPFDTTLAWTAHPVVTTYVGAIPADAAQLGPDDVGPAGTVLGGGGGGGSAWGKWTAKAGQNTGLAWQTGAGDSGPYGGDDASGEAHWAGRFAQGLGHVDVWTSFMVHEAVDQVVNAFQNKKPHLLALTKANVRICQTIPVITSEDVWDDPIKHTGFNLAKYTAVASGPVTGARYRASLAMWQAIAQTFKDIGAKSPVFRMGHEMNGGGYPWAAGPPAQYILLYRRVRAAMLAVNSDIIFCWNPLRGQQKTQWWPGDAYVDIVGVDWYNNGGVAPTDTGYIHDQVSWDAAYLWGTDAEPLGWGRWVNFAAAHGKMLCVPEWGEAHGSSQLPSPDEDAPGYVALLKGFFATRRAAGGFMFDTYFNNAEHQIDPTATYVPNFATRYFARWCA